MTIVYKIMKEVSVILIESQLCISKYMEVYREQICLAFFMIGLTGNSRVFGGEFRQLLNSDRVLCLDGALNAI